MTGNSEKERIAKKNICHPPPLEEEKKRSILANQHNPPQAKDRTGSKIRRRWGRPGGGKGWETITQKTRNHEKKRGKTQKTKPGEITNKEGSRKLQRLDSDHL